MAAHTINSVQHGLREPGYMAWLCSWSLLALLCSPGGLGVDSAGDEAGSAGTRQQRSPTSARTSAALRRTYRTIQIRADHQLLTTEDPLPPDLQDAVALIR